MKDNKYRVTSFRDEIFIDEENIEEVIYRLNTKYEMMNELYEDSEEEIKRLNNIINEIGKYLWEERYNHHGEYVLSGRKAEDIYTLILDKLEELKGSDSNE